MSTEEMTDAITRLGGQFRMTTSREYTSTIASTFSTDWKKALSLIHASVFDSTYATEDIQSERALIPHELKATQSNPEAYLSEKVHEAAFGKDRTLGVSLSCPEERVGVIDRQMLLDRRDAVIADPSKFVLAAAGIPHDQLCEYASTIPFMLKTKTQPPRRKEDAAVMGLAERMGQFAPTFARMASSAATPSFASASLPQSEASVYKASTLLLPPTDQQIFDNVFIAWQGLSVHDDDAYALAIIQSILGGGSDFSAGGPGKGLHSRLYTNIVNRPAVDHCSAFQNMYSDNGLFGLAIAYSPDVEHAWHRLPRAIAREMSYLTTSSAVGQVSQDELDRARNLLKSRIAMGLESQAGVVEDIAAQLILTNKRESLEQTCQLLDAVTCEDVKRVARLVLDQKRNGMTLVMQGANLRPEPWIQAFKDVGMA